jgi:hypothetical protein
MPDVLMATPPSENRATNPEKLGGMVPGGGFEPPTRGFSREAAKGQYRSRNVLCLYFLAI